MNFKFEDHILTVENYFDKIECERYIHYYEYLEESGLTKSRPQNNHVKDDRFIDIQTLYFFTSYDIYKSFTAITNNFLNKFWDTAYKAYTEKYSILNELDKHRCYSIQIQKTKPTEGYHVWHCETGTANTSNRLLTFILYLNDIEEGGETEFLYYPKRIKPEAGKLILFPGSFTHTHRGNQPLKDTKYIVTGWIFFNE